MGDQDHVGVCVGQVDLVGPHLEVEDGVVAKIGTQVGVAGRGVDEGVLAGGGRIQDVAAAAADQGGQAALGEHDILIGAARQRSPGRGAIVDDQRAGVHKHVGHIDRVGGVDFARELAADQVEQDIGGAVRLLRQEDLAVVH